MKKGNSQLAKLEKEAYDANNKPGWNGYDAWEFFIQKVDIRLEEKYNRNRPHQALRDMDEKFLDMDFGERQLYEDLIPLAREKAKTVAFLESVTKENIARYSKAKDQEIYIRSYFDTAKLVLKSINNNEYPFQKSTAGLG